ncbi:unnamed protein product [Moneuplotes crassus]|uniref:Uncharacterized protein n=1 Tax=Euplotes crassus TaxID=5936 RepID=A0AAD1UAZ1_EUPCR|nr:unnamed protein product [Moneuplotes crassus]
MRVIILLFALVAVTLAKYQIGSGQQCYQCATEGSKICRDAIDPEVRHCCGEFEYSLDCGSWNDTQCSDQITDTSDYYLLKLEIILF